MNDIPIRLKELRKFAKLSQTKLGKILNVSQDTISIWETGKSYPSAEYLIALAKLYSVTTDFILGLQPY
ncbi:MAG: helix-turn-helix transcriptional regulator [Bacillota bacterium]